MKRKLFQLGVSLPCSVLFLFIALSAFGAGNDDSDNAEKSMLRVAKAPAKAETNSDAKK
jgi:hypothetical protein